MSGHQHSSDYAPCVAFILVKDNAVLMERRTADAVVDPSCVVIPGGHVEEGEDLVEALRREAREELAVEVVDPRFVCTLVHQSTEVVAISYYWVTSWDGDVECHEAEEVFWLKLEALDRLDFEIDRMAVREGLRLYGR